MSTTRIEPDAWMRAPGTELLVRIGNLPDHAVRIDAWSFAMDSGPGPIVVDDTAPLVALDLR